MSSKRFCELLLELGAPDVSTTLNPENFDWLFVDKNLEPFLNWFCENVNLSCVLSSEELQMHELMDSEFILSDVEVNSVYESKEKSEEIIKHLRNEIEGLETESQNLEKTLGCLAGMKSQLSRHYGLMNRNVENLKKSCTAKQRILQSSIEETRNTNEQFIYSLNDLEATLHMSLNSSFLNSFKNGSILDGANKAESRFNQEVKTFILAIFSGDLGKSNNELNDMKLEKYFESENDRLLYGFKNYEEQKFKLKIRKLESEAALKKWETELKAIGSKLNSDVNKMSHTLQYKQSALNKVESERKTLEDFLNASFGKSDSATSFKIKMAMLEYNISKYVNCNDQLDKVVRLLLGQQIRFETLNIGLAFQDDLQKELSNSLHEIISHISKYNTTYEDRVKWSLKCIQNRQGENTGLEDRNHTDFNNILETPPMNMPGQLRYTVKIMNHFQTSLEKSKQSTIDELSSYLNWLNKIQKAIFRTEKLICNGEMLDNSSPNLNPSQLTIGLQKFGENYTLITNKLMEIIKAYEMKKALLKSPVLCQERMFFTYFYTNPELLKKNVEKLESEVKSHI